MGFSGAGLIGASNNIAQYGWDPVYGYDAGLSGVGLFASYSLGRTGLAQYQRTGYWLTSSYDKAIAARFAQMDVDYPSRPGLLTARVHIQRALGLIEQYAPDEYELFRSGRMIVRPRNLNTPTSGGILHGNVIEVDIPTDAFERPGGMGGTIYHEGAHSLQESMTRFRAEMLAWDQSLRWLRSDHQLWALVSRSERMYYNAFADDPRGFILAEAIHPGIDPYGYYPPGALSWDVSLRGLFNP